MARSGTPIRAPIPPGIGMVYPFILTQFQFNWNAGNAPTLITAQCEVLDVRWDPIDGTGVNGLQLQPPYSLSIYASNLKSPIIFPAGNGPRTNLTIPFPPRTFYIICMYDSAGNPGGCSDEFTVYKPSPDYQQTCQNYTALPGLKVVTARSRFAWIANCDTIELEFTDGQAPFQFSVQAALYPPLNISGITERKFQWRNTLGRTSAFFITVVDANGLMWSQGPMHSGRGQTWCLDYDSPGKVIFANMGIVIGGAVGLFVAGWLVMALFWLLWRYRTTKRNTRTAQPEGFCVEPQQKGNSTPSITGLPWHSPFLAGYEVTPFNPSDGTETSRKNAEGRSLLAATSTNDLEGTASSSDLARPSNQNVYVVHDNDGHAPVTIYTGDSANVVELPPRYIGNPPAQAREEVINAENNTGRTVALTPKLSREQLRIKVAQAHISHGSGSKALQTRELPRRFSTEEVMGGAKALPTPPRDSQLGPGERP